MNRKRILRSWWLWAVLLLFGFLVLPSLLAGGSDYHGVSTSDALKAVQTDTVNKAVIDDKGQTLRLDLKNGQKFQGKYTKISTQYPSNASTDVFRTLRTEAAKPNSGLQFRTYVASQNTWLSLLISLLPILLIVGVLFFVMSQVQGGGNRVMSFGKSKAKLVSKDTPKTTFADVAGADEAIEELDEIKEFLASPAKFQALGAKIPKGVLLYG
ncbi:MAG: ATP-dependent metallopeptidase FtsH/Yme1/Tma family protein, partial [Actinomycetota bacterium]|nr:ATP-dependent metallopeptidase FtsH/Yme1/Tma family protein [Actinomycetota bacterium]